MEKDFIIDKVSWHTKQVRNYDFDTKVIHQYFGTIIRYLQENELTIKNIVSDLSEINDETFFSSSNLTEEGMILIGKAYSKWVDFVVDKNKPNDTSILDRALKKIRSK